MIKINKIFFLSLIYILIAWPAFATETIEIKENIKDFIERNYPLSFRDSNENEIGIIMLRKALEYRESNRNDYTTSILLLDKVIKEWSYGKLGRPQIMYSGGVGTSLGRCYAYYYRNNIYDFAITLKAYWLYEQKKIDEAKLLLMDYIKTIESKNIFSEDYKINFINDENFMNYYRKHVNNENEIKFAYEVSLWKNESTFTLISSNRPDKAALIMLLSIFIIQDDQKSTKKIMNIINKHFKLSMKSEWFEPYFKMKKEMLFSIVSGIIDRYILWNMY